MTPSSSVLGGMDYESARLYGMPHVSAAYTGEGVRLYRLEEGARCLACGRPATNAHHEPPKGHGRSWVLRTPWGRFVLRPALIALCGSGTTGCHGDRHSGLLRFRWEWDDEEDEEAWWNGFLLSHGYHPHDRGLYKFGRWVAYRGGEAVGEWRG